MNINKLSINLLVSICLLTIGFIGCHDVEDHGTANQETSKPMSNDKSTQLIQKMEAVNGGWSALSQLKDVQFTYNYDDKSKGIDLSTERYIFNGESSWGKYTKHNANVLPGAGGEVVQSLVNNVPAITKDGAAVTDKKAVGTTSFLRHANFYWFTMMYKLNDTSTVKKYLGQETINGVNYDKVDITYKGTGKDADDQYILYFNPTTHLVDQFYFSLPAMGVDKPVIRMDLKYKKIDGIYVATDRKTFMPDGAGGYKLGGEYTSSNIKFNNGFTEADLKI